MIRRTARSYMAGLAALVLGTISVLPSATAQEAVWNLRTPEWEAVWPGIAGADDARLRLIRVASELVGYSGKLLPVAPVDAVSATGFLPGHVPVDIRWLDAGASELAFGIARGWGHITLGHTPVGFTSETEEAVA